MSDEQAESSPAELFYKAESAPAKEPAEPAVTSEPAPDTKSEGDEPETASGSEPEKNQEPKSPKAQARIKQLLARVKELEQAEAASKQAPQPKVEKIQLPDFPDPNKFETLEQLRIAEKEYYAKQTQQAIQEALDKDRAERAKQAQEERIREINANIEKIWQKRESQAMKRHPDYTETVYDESGKIKVKLNSAADGFILDSEVGPDILRHLALHPSEAEELMDMNPWQTTRALTKLEDKLSEGLKAPKKVTTAPAPPADVGGRGAVRTVPIDPVELFYGKQ